MSYKVTIVDKHKKIIREYKDVHTIIFWEPLGDEKIITGEDLVKTVYPTDINYKILSSNGSYSINKDMIGILEVEHDI